jgi:hypothetical protein
MGLKTQKAPTPNLGVRSGHRHALDPVEFFRHGKKPRRQTGGQALELYASFPFGDLRVGDEHLFRMMWAARFEERHRSVG